MDERLFFSATERNREHIRKVLSEVLPKSGFVLEIASGSGEHGVTFQEHFDKVSWQTSDPDPLCRKSIRAWINYKSLSKQMPDPIDIDVEKRPWPLTDELRSSLEAVVCINMLHICPWTCTKALFGETANLLDTDQLLIIYGPFKVNGDHISHSNFLFDKALKDQNPYWGVRDLEAVNEIASQNGFKKPQIIEMPANNLSIIFKIK